MGCLGIGRAICAPDAGPRSGRCHVLECIPLTCDVRSSGCAPPPDLGEQWSSRGRGACGFWPELDECAGGSVSSGVWCAWAECAGPLVWVPDRAVRAGSGARAVFASPLIHVRGRAV